jgi:hypothetical protein
MCFAFVFLQAVLVGLSVLSEWLALALVLKWSLLMAHTLPLTVLVCTIVLWLVNRRAQRLPSLTSPSFSSSYSSPWLEAMDAHIDGYLLLHRLCHSAYTICRTK